MNKFMIGCNYWASHAGIEMWANWDAEQVDKDLALLKEYGVEYLRVFPIWHHFQPVMALYGGGGWPREYMLEGMREPTNPWYLDDTMMDRFDQFCDIAEKYDMKLIVGLITGWMSGRLYIPSALNGKNIFTDSFALKLQQKFIRGFVSQFKEKKSIFAWDLGNECNVMADPYGRDGAYTWSAIISNAIKAQDNTRPIVSGMHGLSVEGPWAIEDQAETTDILTTHPYSPWVPHCGNDPVDSYRTLMHGTGESVFYSAIGGKPCLVEELGTLGVNMCTDETSGDFMRLNLFSNWANGNAGVLWWCAFEQDKLNFPPYTWNMMERILGMFDTNLQPKPYLLEMKKFAKWINELDFEITPPETDALVILTKSQDHWGVAYMSYLLAKQAGATLDFLPPNTDIPERDVYIMPSTESDSVLYLKYYQQLKERVKNGATLYVSNNNAFYSEMEEFFGFKVVSRDNTYFGGTFRYNGGDIPYACNPKITLEATTAEVLATDSDGNPMLLLNDYGKGKVYFLNTPLEKNICYANRVFDGSIHKLYEDILFPVLSKKDVSKSHSKVGITVNGNIVTLINYSNEEVDPGFVLRNGKKIDKVYYGNVEKIGPCDAAVFSIK